MPLKCSLNSYFRKGSYRIILLAFLSYVLWVIVTFLTEGRILTLLRPEAVVDRVVYTVAANIIIGILLGLWVLRTATEEKILSLDSAGFRPIRKTIFAVVIAGIMGFILLYLLHPVSLNPIVLINVYAQVLTVSIAEITICWAVIGSSVESFFSGRGRVVAVTAGIIAASLLFGVYHIAHSPPFNQPSMIVFLSLFGIVTSLVYFIGRDIYATMVFHNFFGTLGVMQSLNASGALSSYTVLLVPVIGMALLSLLVFIAIDVFYLRRKAVNG